MAVMMTIGPTQRCILVKVRALGSTESTPTTAYNLNCSQDIIEPLESVSVSITPSDKDDITLYGEPNEVRDSSYSLRPASAALDLWFGGPACNSCRSAAVARQPAMGRGTACTCSLLALGVPSANCWQRANVRQPPAPRPALAARRHRTQLSHASPPDADTDGSGRRRQWTRSSELCCCAVLAAKKD